MNVFELIARLGLDTSEYDKGLNDAKSNATSSGSVISNSLATATKAGAAAITAAAGTATTALVGLSKEAFSSYSDYEQLVGGVNKLYGSASEKVQEYANKAYMTAGISANKYMETATNFSAALISSLGGDVDEAAYLTDVAMKAMSDNVNVFGSDFSSVQNAFQGFSKQNYTMLDNLKLGYGGTKEEMERLLARASELAIEQGLLDESTMKLSVDEEDVAKATDKLASANATLAQKQNAVEKAQISYNDAVAKYGANSSQAQKAALSLSDANIKLNEASRKAANAQSALEEATKGTVSAFSIDSFSDIVTAIDLVQKDMGIANATTKEAMTTIEGSTKATKAAWENLITAIGRGEGISEAFDALIDSIFGTEEGTGLINQIIPRLQTIMDGIGQFIEKASPYIDKYISPLIQQILDTAVPIIITMTETILPQLLPIFDSLADSILNALSEKFPELSFIFDNFKEIVIGALAILASSQILGFITTFVNAISVIGGLLGSGGAIATAFTSIGTLITGMLIPALSGIGTFITATIIPALGGLVAAVAPVLAAAAPFIAIAAAVVAAGVLVYQNWDIIKEKAGELASAVSERWNAIKDTIANSQIGQAVGTIWNAAATTMGNALDAMKSAYDQHGGGLQGAVSAVMEGIKQYYTFGWNFINELTGGKLNEMLSIVTDTLGNMKNTFDDIVSNALTWGYDLINNFADGIRSNLDYVLGLIDDLASAVADLIGFSEPKKGPLSKFHTFAPDMMDLFAKGIKDNTNVVTDQIKDSFDFGNMIEGQVIKSGVSVNSIENNGLSSGMVQNITINAPQELDPSEIARQTRNANREFILQMRMA